MRQWRQFVSWLL